MNTQATQFTTEQDGATILAWPHRGQPISLTKAEVRDKVAATLSSELNVPSGSLSDDTLIREDLDVDIYALGRPIMTIENYFRTLLQDEIAKTDVSIGSIVDRLMGRTETARHCDSSHCACAA